MQVAESKRKTDPLEYLGNDVDSREKVAEFLRAAARNSERTGNTYSFALKHFSKFLDDRYGYPTTIGNITIKIKEGLDVYVLLDSFVSYLMSLPKKLTNTSIISYVGAIRSYLQHYDVEIIPYKLKHRVHMPKEYHEEKQAIDRQDIREMLKACTNRRLKAYLYVLGSGGMRANEALALRIQDVNLSESPTKVHIRKENKTKRPRDIFISDEATRELRKWIDYKYSRRREGTKMVTHEKSDDHLIFTLEFNDSTKSTMLYSKINEAFHQVLKSVGQDEIKEDSHSYRRKITLNSFRRFVRTTLSDQVSSDYAEWFIGHAKSSYWTKKPEEKKQIYVDKCMKSLTFLDFSGLETRTKNIETQVQILTEANRKYEEEIETLRWDVHNSDQQIEQLQKEREIEIKKFRQEIASMDRFAKDTSESLKGATEHLKNLWKNIVPESYDKTITLGELAELLKKGADTGPKKKLKKK
jgi:integrase